MNKKILRIGIIMAALSVILGAFGSHGLQKVLTETNRKDIYQLAVQYQFYHALGIIITGLLTLHYSSNKITYAFWCFTGGIVFFSGSLYVLSITGIKYLGAITPIGGVLFIAGWLLLLLGINEQKK